MIGQKMGSLDAPACIRAELLIAEAYL